MKTYYVKFTSIFGMKSFSVQVQANNKTHAENEALKHCDNNNLDYNGFKLTISEAL